MLAAACGSSSSSGTTTTAAPGGSTSTTSAGGGGSSSTTTTTSSTGTGSAFLGKFQSGEHATFIATYKVTSSSNSSSSLEDLTIAQQAPNALFKGVSSAGTFELITRGTKSYLCSETNGTWLCFNGGKSNPEAALFAVYEPGTYFPEVQAAVKAEGGQASYSTKSVNGFELSCVSVSGATGEKGSGTYCVTAQGILGYVSYSSGASKGGFEIESFSTSVPSSEFTLPATPSTIP